MLANASRELRKVRNLVFWCSAYNTWYDPSFFTKNHSTIWPDLAVSASFLAFEVAFFNIKAVINYPSPGLTNFIGGSYLTPRYHSRAIYRMEINERAH